MCVCVRVCACVCVCVCACVRATLTVAGAEFDVCQHAKQVPISKMTQKCALNVVVIDSDQGNANCIFKCVLNVAHVLLEKHFSLLHPLTTQLSWNAVRDIMHALRGIMDLGARHRVSTDTDRQTQHT